MFSWSCSVEKSTYLELVCSHYISQFSVFQTFSVFQLFHTDHPFPLPARNDKGKYKDILLFSSPVTSEKASFVITFCLSSVVPASMHASVRR